MDSQTAEQIESAYVKAQAALADLNDAAATLALAKVLGWEEPYEFNPLMSLAKDSRRLFEGTRKDLIKRIGEDLNEQYTPNVKRPDDFYTKLMDTRRSENGFSIDVLTAFFENEIRNTPAVNLQSLRDLQQKVKQLIPYGRDEGHEWGPEIKLEDSRLELHAHTWHVSYGPGSVETYRLTEALQALEALLDVAAGSEPRTAKGNAGILTHAQKNRTPEVFYMKQEPKHPTVRAFRFFKNGKFLIDFKTAQAAHDLATILLPEKVAPEVATA